MPNIDLTRIQTPQDITAARLAEWRAGAIRSKAAFAIALAEAGIITVSEAEGWIDGTLPAAVTAAIATLPAGEQSPARITVKGATTVHRSDPILILLGSAYGLSDAQVDTLFGTPPG